MKYFIMGLALLAISCKPKEKPAEFKGVRLNEIIHTKDEFAVMVTGCKTERYAYLGLGKNLTDPSNRYLIISAYMKNESSSPGRVDKGAMVIITSNGTMQFQPEDAYGQEYGFISGLEELNPMAELNTKIVFSIPKSVYGKVVWIPRIGDIYSYIRLPEINSYD